MQYQRSERDLRRLTDVYKLCWFYQFIEGESSQIIPLISHRKKTQSRAQSWAERQAKIGLTSHLFHLWLEWEIESESLGCLSGSVGQWEDGGERTLRWPIPSMSSDGVRSEDVMGVVDSRPPPGPHITLTTLYTSLNSHQNSSRISKTFSDFVFVLPLV